MKKVFSLILFSLIIQVSNGQEKKLINVESPGRKIVGTISLTNGNLTFSAYKNSSLILQSPCLGMNVNGFNIGEKVILEGTSTKKVIDERYDLFGNHSQAENNCNEVTVPLKSHGIPLNLFVRSYNGLGRFTRGSYP